MNKSKTFSLKKLMAVLLAAGLSVICLFGILFGTNKSASAEVGEAGISHTIYRKNEYKITDDGPLKNPYDYFSWDKIALYSVLKENYYEWATVTIEFEVKEEDKGYQDVYLYKASWAEKDDYVAKMTFEYGGTKLVTTYGKVIVCFKSILISKFEITNTILGLVVRYDAHGAGSDNWYNRECHITLNVTKNIVEVVDGVKGAVFTDSDYR